MKTYKPASYSGEDVMLLEQNGKYHKTSGVIGCTYEWSRIPESFKEAYGEYRVNDERFKDLSCKCCLKAEDNVLILEIKALNAKLNSCLKVIAENLTIIQGFGRLARQMVELQKREEGDYVTFSRIIFKKM